MMSLRCQEEGWVKIGLTCSAGRRSLWARIGHDGTDGKDATVELCSGREGDDWYCCVKKDNPAHEALWEVITTAIWIAEEDLE